MSDRIDHILSLGEEPAPAPVGTPSLEDSAPSERYLHVPEEGVSIEGTTQLSEKDLSVFCQTGLLPQASEDQSTRRTDLIPAILHPYLGAKTFRRPWPLFVTQTRTSLRIKPLSSVFDMLVEGIEDQGDTGELQKRALFRIEQLMTEASNREPVLAIHPELDDIESEIQAQSGDREDRMSANTWAIQSFRSLSDEGSLLFGYSAAGLRELMITASVRISDGRQRVFKEDIEWLATRLEDLLRVEEEDSKQGHTPEKLEHSVGGAYVNTIDFSSLSHLLDEAPHGAAIEKARRLRIEQTLSSLSELSAELFSDRRKSCFRNTEEASLELKSRVAEFTRLARAKQVAQLEIENQYRPKIHDALFDAFDYESIPATERKAFPPVLVHLPADEAGKIGEFDSMLNTLGEAGTFRILVTYSALFNGHAVSSMALDVARSAVTRGDVFVQQSTAANADFVASGIQLSARTRGSSLLTIYTGLDTAVSGVDAFMSAALAADSRTVPAFRFDPENGEDWADQFSASENEQSDSTWASEQIDVRSGDSTDPRSFSTTTADLLILDSRFTNQFLAIASSVQSADLIELTDFLSLEESSRIKKMPYIWVRDDSDYLLRVVLAPTIVRAVDIIRKRWKVVQEWSGLNSSILKRGLTDAQEAAQKQIDAAIASAQEEFDLRMNESTQALAHQIVENIAASLLGMQATDASISRAVPSVIAVPAESAELLVETPAEKPATPDPQNEPEEAEDDLGISLDDAYIDTPLCTSCNECTDLNGLIFGYDGDKQAFIKDAAAGPYRDMVLAAEKCPVRIIHPGKPHDESEKNLAEWIERAKPFL